MRKLVPIVVLSLLAAACAIEAPGVRLSGNGESGVAAKQASNDLRDALVADATAVQGLSLVQSTGARRTSCARDSLGPGVTNRTIKIGASLAQSGPLQSLTAPAVKSIKAHFNLVNSRGGIHGRKIEFVYLDDGWDAQRGKINIKTLVAKEKVLALTISSTNGVDAATQYLEEQRVPVLGMSGALPSQFSSPVIFPVGVPFDASARITLHDAATRLRARTVALIWLDVQIGVEVRDAINRTLHRFAPEMSLVASRRVSMMEPTMEPVWNDIQNQTRDWQRAHGQRSDGRPDFVLFAIDPANAIKALQAAERLGVRPRIGWGGLSPVFLDLVLGSTDVAARTRLYSSSPFIPPLPEFEHLPAVREYISTIRRYVEERDVLNPVVEFGWIAAALTVRAVHDAGPCPTRERVLAAAERITGWQIAGLTQPLTFRPPGQGAGHMANDWSVIVQAVPRGTAGCSRSIGCWRWVKVPTPTGWYRDPIRSEASR